MTRVYFAMGSLRLRLILGVTIGTAVLGVTELAGGQRLLGLSPLQLQQQTLTWGVYATFFVLVLSAYVMTYLRGVARFLSRVRDEEGLEIPAAESAAVRRTVLRFPVDFVLVGMGLATFLTASKIPLDVLVFDLPAGAAVGLATGTATLTLAAGVLFYLVTRGWMRPLLAHFRHEEVPEASRIPVTGKVAFALVTLGLASTVPTAVIGAGRILSLEQQSAERYGQHLADTLAHGSSWLAEDSWKEALAAARLPGRQVRLGDRPTAASAPLVPGHGASFLQLTTLEPSHAPAGELSVLVVLATLLLGVAVFVGRNLGLSLSQDIRSVTQRISLLAQGPQADAEPTPKGLSPLVAGAPQFSDLRELTSAVNALLSRITSIHVAHFVAVERTLEADQLRTQFLANMSHDLRSPLNSILGFAELLLQGMEGELPPAQHQAIETIHRNGTELLHLVNEVLESAKLEAGRLALHREDMPPAELLSAALKEAHSRGVPAGVELSSELQAGLPVLFVDGPRLAEALAYLVTYAAQALQNGRIQVRVRATPPAGETRITEQRLTLQLVVADDGPGLSEEEKEHLFSGFRRRPGQRGLNLGLPLARALIELHGGTLAVYSAAGQGTTFMASVPVQARRMSGRFRPVRV
ncbi:MAG: HAMP domain-containing histidine kinase [Deltaproteobacteria bacterium]|nr:HAMP domain-containing histidine kinase [Deltaproteobacteria bacterium]